MESLTIIIYAASFFAVTSFCLACLAWQFRDKDQVDERLAGLSTKPAAANNLRPRPLSTRAQPGKRPANARTRLALRLLPNDADERQLLQTRLLHAGIYSPVALPVFLAIKILLIGLPPVLGALAGAAGWIDPRQGLLYGSALGVMGLILPSIWLSSCKAKWHAAINRSLPDFLDLMVACLEAGLSAEAALQRVTEELRLAHPRLSAELSVVQAQVELGATSDAALKNFADRSDCEAIQAIANVVQNARRLGGGIAEAFRQQTEVLRTRREHLAEERAQQAAVKILLPTLLFIFPAVFVVLAGPAAIQLAEKFGNGVALN